MTTKTAPAFVLVLAAAAVLAQPMHEGKWLTRPARPPAVDYDSTHHFDVRFYQVDLSLPMTSGAMSARCRVELVPRHDGFDTFSLHLVSLVCDSIRRDGNVCTFTTPSGRLLVDLDREFQNGESLGVDVYYHRNAGTGNRGFFFYSRPQANHPLAYSVTETDDSRYWFPCFDQPWDKAERGCRINVTVPDSLQVCANGMLDSVSTAPVAGTKTYWWTHRYPISTYLMCFAASRFANWPVWFHHGADSMPVRFYVWPEDSSRAAGNFSRMTDMLEFFSQDELYGPYPFFAEKYGMVAVYPYPWGGMEHQTMTTIHRYWATNGSVNGIAHELAHQWWGDMVTCLDWRNIWLNEGFATYSDELYDLHQNGRASFLSLIQRRAEDYFDEEASDPHPIYAPPPGHEFDWGHSYCKGGWVQHMLRYVVGDTTWPATGTFFQALREYGESLQYGTANTEDWRRIAERVSGLDLGWFFDEWVYAMGYPHYTCGWQSRETGDGWEAVVDLVQNNGTGVPAVFHMPAEIRVQFAGGDTVIRYPVLSSPQRNAFPVSAQPTGVVFDPNEWILDKHTVQVGIGELAGTVRAPRLSVRPNPARNRVGLQLAADGPAEIDIFDAGGRRVLARRLAIGHWDLVIPLDVRTLSSGVYLVRLSDGRSTTSARLVLAD